MPPKRQTSQSTSLAKKTKRLPVSSPFSPVEQSENTFDLSSAGRGRGKGKRQGRPRKENVTMKSNSSSIGVDPLLAASSETATVGSLS